MSVVQEGTPVYEGGIFSGPEDGLRVQSPLPQMQRRWRGEVTVYEFIPGEQHGTRHYGVWIPTPPVSLKGPIRFSG